jgi:hypothetical protein
MIKEVHGVQLYTMLKKRSKLKLKTIIFFHDWEDALYYLKDRYDIERSEVIIANESVLLSKKYKLFKKYQFAVIPHTLDVEKAGIIINLKEV